MADQLLPPPKLSPEDSVKVWIELLDLGEELVQAGLGINMAPNEARLSIANGQPGKTKNRIDT